MWDEWGSTIFVIGVILFFGWFVAGMWWNLRKGNASLRWLREGLPAIGERTTMRWLGTSVVEMKIAKAKDPFRNAETLFVFEPRDVALLWAIARARGRRDLMIFRAQLRSAPAFELEAIAPKAWTTQGIARNVRGKNWTQLDPGLPELETYYSGAAGATASKAMIDLAQSVGAKLVRVSVHRTVPNLEVHWHLPDPYGAPARDLFSKLRQMSEIAMRG
jgi:hypothetical protein